MCFLDAHIVTNARVSNVGFLHIVNWFLYFKNKYLRFIIMWVKLWLDILLLYLYKLYWYNILIRVPIFFIVLNNYVFYCWCIFFVKLNLTAGQLKIINWQQVNFHGLENVHSSFLVCTGTYTIRILYTIHVNNNKNI